MLSLSLGACGTDLEQPAADGLEVTLQSPEETEPVSLTEDVPEEAAAETTEEAQPVATQEEEAAAEVTEEAQPVATQEEEAVAETPEEAESESLLDPEGSYTTKEDVSLYLVQYGELPSNFMTKKEAKALGWEGGSLEPYAPGMCIGGDRFGNYEEILPEGDYHECDIDTLGAKSRGAKRLVYSADGRIYYTQDHYESFELLYGEE